MVLDSVLRVRNYACCRHLSEQRCEKKEQQNTNQTNSLAQAQGALAEREAMIAKMRANGMSDEDIQKYLH